jgi:hypothetical protein
MLLLKKLSLVIADEDVTYLDAMRCTAEELEPVQERGLPERKKLKEK